ncbi:MAG: hypothetical protein ABSA69_09150, partial [Verrucomicrobiota bacterium]
MQRIISQRNNPVDGGFVSRKPLLVSVPGKPSILNREHQRRKKERPDFRPAFSENKALQGFSSGLRWPLTPVIRCGATDIRRS